MTRLFVFLAEVIAYVLAIAAATPSWVLWSVLFVAAVAATAAVPARCLTRSRKPEPPRATAPARLPAHPACRCAVLPATTEARARQYAGMPSGHPELIATIPAGRELRVLEQLRDSTWPAAEYLGIITDGKRQ